MYPIARRRKANAGPLSRACWLLGLAWALAVPVRAEQSGDRWRATLLGKAEQALYLSGPGEAVHDAVRSAITEIDGLTDDNSIPDHVRQLADSLVTELLAHEAATHMREDHPSQAVVAYRMALDRAQRMSEHAMRRNDMIDALAFAQVQAGDEEAALRTYDEALDKLRAAKDTDGERDLLLKKAVFCSELGRHQEAIAVNKRLLVMAETSRSDQDRITALLRLSRAYSRINATDAFTYAREAYALAEKVDNGREMLRACEILIRSWQTTSENEQCRRLLEEGLKKATDRQVPSEVARFQDRFGRYYMREHEYDKALGLFEAGLRTLGARVPLEDPSAGSRQTNELLAELLLDMGSCYSAKLDTANALLHLQECERIVKSDDGIRVSPWAELGEIHLSLGDVSKALAYGNLALNDAERLVATGGEDDDGLMRRASHLLYRIYKLKGDAVNALDMHERYMEVALSEEKLQNSLDLQRTQLNLTFSEKQLTDSIASVVKEEALRNDNAMMKARTRYLVLGGIVLFLGTAAVAFIDRKRRMARFDKEAAQLETQALRSQMNPHFIFNALNSINAFVQKNEPDKAASFLSRFARLMRLVLENSRQSEVPLKDDLEALDAYLHLERARSGEKFDYRIEVAADIDPEDVMVPPLVAQPFVENAIWHGMSGKEEKGLIKLSISRKGDQLLFAIEDDGVGRSSPKRMARMGQDDPAQPTKKTSLGTAITKARLDLVRQQKGKDAGFVYVDLPQGTRVELTLPFSTAA